MKFLILAALLSDAASAPVDMLGYLGSTLEAFRARPAPAAAQTACSDASDHLPWLAPDPLSIRAGVVRCAFVRRLGDRVARADIAVMPGREGPADFWFFEDRLYRIEMSLDARHRAALLSHFVARWGAPERRGRRALAWDRGSHRVVLASPGATSPPAESRHGRRISLVFSDPAIAEIVEARRVKLTQPPRIMTR